MNQITRAKPGGYRYDQWLDDPTPDHLHLCRWHWRNEKPNYNPNADKIAIRIVTDGEEHLFESITQARLSFPELISRAFYRHLPLPDGVTVEKILEVSHDVPS